MVDFNSIINGPKQNMNTQGVQIFEMPHTPPHEHLLSRGRDCAVYDATVQTDYKFFKYHSRSLKNKSQGQIEEDLKAKLNELKLDSEKSPIAKLNEIMFLKKKPIYYELVSMTGHVHNPVFTFCAKSDELVVFGSGSSKKLAKQHAAVAFLDKMDCSNGINTITSTTSSISPTPFMNNSEDHMKKIMETKSELNPIGLLQEMCMARHWELPNYEYLTDIRNEAHNPLYTVRCSLKDHNTTGAGKTKQSAKRDAAYHMYNHFKDSEQDKTIVPFYGEYTTPIKAMLNNNSITTDIHGVNNIDQLEKLQTSDVQQRLVVFLDTLKKSNKTGLNRLKQLNLIKEFSISAVDILDQIGKEEGFDTNYVLVTPKLTRGQSVLVQVSITPHLVNVGIGGTVEEAQENAAFSILLYLKVMLEK